MKKKSVTKNYIYNLIYQILSIILPLITAPYISRILGAENIGISSYVISISTYFIIFGSLGTTSYGQREISYIQDDVSKYSQKFWEILLLRFSTMLISTVIFSFIFIFNKHEYSIYFIILLIELFSKCIDISWFFQGLEEFKQILIRNIIIRIISIICIFSFVKSANDLHIYLIVYVVSNLLGNLMLWAYLPSFIKKVPIKRLKIIKHLKPTLVLFIPQIAIQIYTVLDKVMIGKIVPDKAISGYYEQSHKIITILLTIITSLGTVMLSRIANEFAKGNDFEINNKIYKAFRFVYFLSFPMIAGLFLISNQFIPMFFGSGYDQVVSLIILLSPILLIIGLSNVIGNQYLLPTKRQKEYNISVIVGAIINFILNLFLIRSYGAIGAAVATVIAEMSVTITQLIYIRKRFNISTVITLSFKYLISSVLMFITCYPIECAITNSLLSIVVTVIVGIIVYLLILLLLRDSFVLLILRKLFSRRSMNEKI